MNVLSIVMINIHDNTHILNCFSSLIALVLNRRRGSAPLAFQKVNKYAPHIFWQDDVRNTFFFDGIMVREISVISTDRNSQVVSGIRSTLGGFERSRHFGAKSSSR